MKILEKSSGDKILHKFIFIPSQQYRDLPKYDKYYDNYCNGYLIVWNFTYNTITRDCDEEDYPHSDYIDNLPEPLYSQYKHGGGWGIEDVGKDGSIKLFISDSIPQITANRIRFRLKRK